MRLHLKSIASGGMAPCTPVCYAQLRAIVLLAATPAGYGIYGRCSAGAPSVPMPDGFAT